MPNWCENRLVVASEDKKGMKKFLSLLGVSEDWMDSDRHRPDKVENLLSVFYPMPKELEGTKSPSSSPNWYSWCIDNWGTKWDVTAYVDDLDTEYLVLTFESAWSPPVQWLEKVAKDYPTLDFILRYDEGGMCFMGVAKGRDGVVDDQNMEYCF